MAQKIDMFLQEKRSAAAVDALKKEVKTLDMYLEDEKRMIHQEGQVSRCLA